MREIFTVFMDIIINACTEPPAKRVVVMYVIHVRYELDDLGKAEKQLIRIQVYLPLYGTVI